MKNFVRISALAAFFAGAWACGYTVEQPALPFLSSEGTTFNMGADGATQTIKVVTNRSFSIVSDVSWLAFDPEYVEVEAGVSGEYEVEVTALPTTIGSERTASFTVKTLTHHVGYTVVQAGDPTKMPFEVYSNNFDKEAGPTSSPWKYLDNFNGWRNQTGSGVTDALEYYGNGISIRNNSNSSGSHSLYAGSGTNNLFFGTSAWFAVGKIALHPDHRGLNLSFGTEKYAYGESDNTFVPAEFPVYVSVDGTNWVSVDYTFATGTWPDGEWDLATAPFTLPASAEYLYIRFASTITSAHRLDDVKVTASADPVGEVIDWSKGTSFSLSEAIAESAE